MSSSRDLRSIKTERALYAAIFSLLKKFSFRKITVKEICEEVLISRAAFYAHFIDKYDLLRKWLSDLWSKNFDDDYSYEYLEATVNKNIDVKVRILKNLFYEADEETFELLFDFVLSTRKNCADKLIDSTEKQRQQIASNFYAGGIISYFIWQIKNDFPPDTPLINKSLYEMIVKLEMQDKIR